MTAFNNYAILNGEDFSFFIENENTFYRLDFKNIHSNSLLLTIHIADYSHISSANFVHITEDEFEFNADFLRELIDDNLCVVDRTGKQLTFLLKKIIGHYKVFVKIDSSDIYFALTKGIPLIHVQSDKMDRISQVVFEFAIEKFELDYSSDFYLIKSEHATRIIDDYLENTIRQNVSEAIKCTVEHEEICLLDYNAVVFTPTKNKFDLTIKSGFYEGSPVKIAINHEEFYLLLNPNSGYIHISKLNMDEAFLSSTTKSYSMRYHIFNDNFALELDKFIGSLPNTDLYNLVSQPTPCLEAFGRIFHIVEDDYSFLKSAIESNAAFFPLIDEFYFLAFKYNFNLNTTVIQSENDNSLFTVTFKGNEKLYNLTIETSKTNQWVPDDYISNLYHSPQRIERIALDIQDNT